MFHQVNYRLLPTLMPEEEFQFQANKNHLNVNILVMNWGIKSKFFKIHSWLEQEDLPLGLRGGRGPFQGHGSIVLRESQVRRCSLVSSRQGPRLTSASGSGNLTTTRYHLPQPLYDIDIVMFPMKQKYIDAHSCSGITILEPHRLRS